MSEKADLLAGADAEFVRFKEAFEGLGEAQLSEVWCGTWSADLFREMDTSHADFKRAAAAVPDDRVVPGKTAHRIVDFNSRRHYQVHRDDIAGWRKSRGI